MNQYTVTFTLFAQDLSCAEEATRKILPSNINTYIVKELNPETHYGAVLTETASEQNNKIMCPKCGYDTGHYDLRSQLEELIRPKALAYEQEQNSSDDPVSIRAQQNRELQLRENSEYDKLDIATGQGRR